MSVWKSLALRNTHVEETLEGFLPDGREAAVNETKGGRMSSEATTDAARFAARERR